MSNIIPGITINLKSNIPTGLGIGARGVAVTPYPLNWGKENELIEVFSTDLTDGRSLAKIGMTGFDKEAFGFSLMASNCSKIYVMRSDLGGNKAKAMITESGDHVLEATAKYTGVLGNQIQIQINVFGDKFEILTFVRNQQRDRQLISTLEDLQNNSFVDFRVRNIYEEEPPYMPDEPEEPPYEPEEPYNLRSFTLKPIAGMFLSGGANGQINETELYPKMFKLTQTKRFNTIAVPTKNEAVKKQALIFATEQRNSNKFIQAIIPDFRADSEAVISINQETYINDRVLTKDDMTYWVAGATAGASLVDSLTANTLNGVTDIVEPLDKRDLEENITNGFLSFSAKQNGQIMVTRDINTLTTFGQEKSREFSKNKVLRVIDTILTDIVDLWQNNYMGTVANNEQGRALLKADICGYLIRVEDLGAIREFNPELHATVNMGERIEDVEMGISIKPVDSMEFLNFTLIVSK